jgi:hypothetical protein
MKAPPYLRHVIAHAALLAIDKSAQSRAQYIERLDSFSVLMGQLDRRSVLGALLLSNRYAYAHALAVK